MNAQTYRDAIFAAICQVVSEHNRKLVAMRRGREPFVYVRSHAAAIGEIDRCSASLMTLCEAAGDDVLALAVQIHYRQYLAYLDRFTLDYKAEIKCRIGVYAASKSFQPCYDALYESMRIDMMRLAERAGVNLKNAELKFGRMMEVIVRRPVSRLISDCLDWSDEQFETGIFQPGDFDAIALGCLNKKYLSCARAACVSTKPIEDLVKMLAHDVYERWKKYLSRTSSNPDASGPDMEIEIEIDLASKPGNAREKPQGDCAWDDSPMAGLGFFTSALDGLTRLGRDKAR